jgi:hypothetical protein
VRNKEAMTGRDEGREEERDEEREEERDEEREEEREEERDEEREEERERVLGRKERKDDKHISLIVVHHHSSHLNIVYPNNSKSITRIPFIYTIRCERITHSDLHGLWYSPCSLSNVSTCALIARTWEVHIFTNRF